MLDKLKQAIRTEFRQNETHQLSKLYDFIMKYFHIDGIEEGEELTKLVIDRLHNELVIDAKIEWLVNCPDTFQVFDLEENES